MDKHAPQIRLCESCEQAVRRIAERGDAAGTAWYCEHGAGVLAVITIKGRTISSWVLEGPIPEAEAKLIIADGLEDGLERWQAEQGPRH